MKKQAVAKITKEIVKQFPEMDGVRPAVKRQQSASNGIDQYLITYSGAVELPGGKTMKRIVRVVADEDGQVIRISTSR